MKGLESRVPNHLNLCEVTWRNHERKDEVMRVKDVPRGIEQ